MNEEKILFVIYKENEIWHYREFKKDESIAPFSVYFIATEKEVKMQCERLNNE